MVQEEYFDLKIRKLNCLLILGLCVLLSVNSKLATFSSWIKVLPVSIKKKSLLLIFFPTALICGLNGFVKLKYERKIMFKLKMEQWMKKSSCYIYDYPITLIILV